MRYRAIASVLSLLIGSGVAVAQNADVTQPASPSQRSDNDTNQNSGSTGTDTTQPSTQPSTTTSSSSSTTTTGQNTTGTSTMGSDTSGSNMQGSDQTQQPSQTSQKSKSKSARKHTGTVRSGSAMNQGASTSKEVKNANVFFKTNSAALSSTAQSDLRQLADWARCDNRNAIILEGFADPRGSQAHNRKLSAARAAAVRERLISMGVPSNRIVISVYGENGPKRGSLAKERRVTARVETSPVTPSDLQTSG